MMTDKQRRQLRIAYVLFPELVKGNDTFRNDLFQLTVKKSATADNNRCQGNLLNDLFSIKTINGNKIIKFNVYGSGLVNITYIFYADGTSNRILIINETWGTSNIKFMRSETTRNISLLDNNGSIKYVYEQKEIEYKKHLLHANNKTEIITDPKRSGVETSETLYLTNDKYVKLITDIKNRSSYYLGIIRKDFFCVYDNVFRVNQDEYEQTLSSCLLLRKK